MFIWKIEVRGQGVLPYQFATKAEAELYAGATFPWTGQSWRLVKTRKVVRA